MEDLIRRSDAIEAINSVGWLEDAEYEEKILAIPTIEPKRGEWAKRTHNTLIAQVNFAYCSECGQPIMHEHTRPLWNFCPNCGADMRSKIVGKHADFMMIDEACVKGEGR